MLEQLFGSKTRVKLLQLFLNNPQQPFYLRELARELKSQLNSIRREVANLEQIGIIKSAQTAEAEQKPTRFKKTAKKFFLADSNFILYPELKALLLKAQLLLERDFVKQVERLGRVKLFILTGVFVGLEGMATDMLLVGSVNHQRVDRLVKQFQKELSHEINYTVMSLKEFKYRKDITDRFLYDILEGEKIVVLNEI